MICTCFLDVVKHRTAGDPQDQEVFWTHYSVKEIREQMSERGFPVSRYDVANLMKTFGFKRRSLAKTRSPKKVENRNDQFEKIAKLKEFFLSEGYPVLSLDTKKKELLGDFHRSGTYFGTKTQHVYDHDFPSYAEGKVIPHGIYDVGHNKGYLSLGISRDTSEFVCDNVEYFWKNSLQWEYPTTEWVLFLCDSGGSNNCRHYIFKEDLYNLAQRLQINIMVAHYPTYCSKYNPIEHRLFPHIHQKWKGVVFKDIQIVKERAAKTTTKTGLSVEVVINEREYATKRQCRDQFKNNISDYLFFDQELPKWNYSVRYKPL